MMFTIHQIAALLLSGILSVTLSGCGNQTSNQAPVQNPDISTEQVEDTPDDASDDALEDNAISTAIDWSIRDYEYTIEDMPTEIDGQSIYGRIYRPLGVEVAMPAVIFSHGYGGTHATGMPYAETLASKGIVSYCFDFRGGSSNNRSDGTPLEMSVFTEKADLEAVLTMIQSLDYVDTNNIFLMGSSQGGMVSAMVAADHQDEIRGMSLLYPAFCIPEHVRARYSSEEEIPDTLSMFSWLTVGHNYAADVLHYDVYEDVTTYERDILIIHGDQDSIVDLSYSQRAAEQYPSAELKVISGAGHSFSGANFDLAMDYVFDYLGSHMN